MILPLERFQTAYEKKVHRNLLFVVAGGIGDEVCAEPTLRYALKTMTQCKISLAAYHPELFSWLFNFEKVYTIGKDTIDFGQYYRLDTFPPVDREQNPFQEIVSTYETNGVDFCSLSALRCQLPLEYRTPRPAEARPDFDEKTVLGNDHIYIHPGKSWPSKTYPKEWWDEITAGLVKSGYVPVLIGNDTVDDVTVRGPDLRNRLSLLETVYLLNRAKALLTNDSAPLHLAAGGMAEIGFITSVKHPSHLFHHRIGGFAWRMKEFTRGGLWLEQDRNPGGQVPDVVNYQTRALPAPSEIFNWIRNLH